METQIAWRVMAVMFDDDSTFLASCGVSRLVKHSGLSDRINSRGCTAFIGGHVAKWQQEPKRGIWKEKHDKSDMMAARVWHHVV